MTTRQQFDAIVQPSLAGVQIDAAIAQIARANLVMRDAGVPFDYDAAIAPLKAARAAATAAVRAAWNAVSDIDDNSLAALQARVRNAVDSYANAA